MTELIHTTDHVRSAVLNLNGPFLGKPRIASFVWAIISGLQEVEDAIQSVINLRQVDNAELPQLQVLGRIVGQIYSAEEVETYRALIKARIVANRSSGTINDLLRVIQAMDYAGVPRWWNPDNTIISIRIDEDDTVPLAAINQVLRAAKAAHERLIIYSTPAANPHAIWGASAGGWGRASDPNVGGRLYRAWG